VWIQSGGVSHPQRQPAMARNLTLTGLRAFFILGDVGGIAMAGKGSVLQGTKLGGSKKGPGLKLQGDWKPDTFGKKTTKAPKKSV